MALVYFVVLFLIWAFISNYLELKLKKSKPLSHAIGIGAAILVLLMLPPLPSGKRAAPEPASSSTPEDLSLHAWTVCKGAVEEKLKAPSTADFPWLPDKVSTDGEGLYIVLGHVDAQNSFGAVLRSQVGCKLKYQGGSPSATRSWERLQVSVE